MKRTRAQIKAEMIKRVEKEIDELLDWREEILQARQGGRNTIRDVADAA